MATYFGKNNTDVFAFYCELQQQLVAVHIHTVANIIKLFFRAVFIIIIVNRFK